jgi:hypothetical protein
MSAMAEARGWPLKGRRLTLLQLLYAVIVLVTMVPLMLIIVCVTVAPIFIRPLVYSGLKLEFSGQVRLNRSF